MRNNCIKKWSVVTYNREKQINYNMYFKMVIYIAICGHFTFTENALLYLK